MMHWPGFDETMGRGMALGMAVGSVLAIGLAILIIAALLKQLRT